MTDFTILHTNDFHNRLDATKAERIQSMKARCGALLIDAGDAAWAGNAYFKPGGEPVFDLMNEAGYDAMAVGNREFHFTGVGFASKLSRARFPVLCANIRASKNQTLPTQAWMVTHKDDTSIAVFGLTVPMVTERMRTAAFSAFLFSDPLEAAKRAIGELRSRCDFLIALTHIGLTRDKELADHCPEIDLIVGGHSHDMLEAPIERNGVKIVQAGSHARKIGVMRVAGRRGDWNIEGRLEELQANANCLV